MVHIWWKKGRLKKTRTIHSQGLSVFNMQKHFLFVSSFELINLAIKKYSKKIMTTQIIMLHL
jgi:hypothetical protein